MAESRKVARYVIGGELYCGSCAENIGASFIAQKRFIEHTNYCAGCDNRSVIERMKYEFEKGMHRR